MGTDKDHKNKRILNPFIFASETNLRFTLLIISALLLTFNESLNLAIFFNIAVEPSAPSIDIQLSDPKSVEQGLTEWQSTLRQSLSSMAFPIASMTSVVMLAMVIYRGHAKRIRRNQNLQVLTRDKDPHFADRVQELISLSEISPAPSIEIASGSKSTDGQAFGFSKQYTLRLGGNLRLLLRKKPAEFRAIVLHELAHIANADVGRTYFAQAIWVATLALVFVPAIALIFFEFINGLPRQLTAEFWLYFFTKAIPTILILLFQFGGTLSIIAAIRGSLLRTREIYADWRAVLWGAKEPLMDILLREKVKDGMGFRNPLRLHPLAQERLKAIENPNKLFQVTRELPFFVGVLLGYTLVGATSLLGTIFMPLLAFVAISILQLAKLVDNLKNPMIAIFLMIILITILIILALSAVFWWFNLIAGTLGLEIQREAVADLTSNRRGWMLYVMLWEPALLTAVGLMIGILLTPKSILGLLPSLINFNGLTALLMVLILTGSTAISTWFWLTFNRYFGRQVFGSYTITAPPQSVRRLLAFASTGLLLVLYVPVLLGELIIETTNTRAIPLQDFVDFAITNVEFLVLYGVIFFITWLFVKLYKLIWKSYCPSCKKAVLQQPAVGQLCKYCNQELATWPFVSDT